MLFKFLASYILGPQDDATQGDPDAGVSIEQLMYLADATVGGSYALAVDSPVPVSLGGLSGVSALILTSTSKCTVRLTSAAGTQQLVPMDSILVLLSQTVPFTAIDLIRPAGIPVTVKVFLGSSS